MSKVVGKRRMNATDYRVVRTLQGTGIGGNLYTLEQDDKDAMGEPCWIRVEHWVAETDKSGRAMEAMFQFAAEAATKAAGTIQKLHMELDAAKITAGEL